MSKIRIALLCLAAILAAMSLSAYHPRLQTDYSAPPVLTRPARADSAHGFDITKYEITLSVNDQTHFISGSVKAYVTAEETLTGIDYELVGLNVSQVKVNDTVSTFMHQNGILHINLNAPSGQQFTTEVTYSGVPILSPAPYNLGMIFGANTVFTISDPDASRYWWPCYDHPWDKAIVDLHITMRSDWLVACNGLRASIVDNGNGTKTHNWLGSNPMAPYLVCVTAGPYVEINQTSGDLPIQNFVTQTQYNNALIDFSTLPAIIQFFESQFGPYPFEKYGNTVVNMTTYGAMEHQTMTTLGSYLITGTHSGEVTIAHELAHQWYGNCLTPLTFKDVWLSEGFATYSEFLWTHEKYDWQTACAYANSSFHQYYISFENSYPSLPNIIYDPPFNYYFYPQSYEKAASVLHMLRLKIGNAAFFQLLQTWFSTYHNGNVVTAEFQAMAEQISGQDLDQFFQQWIYSRGIPSVEYTRMINIQAGQGKLVGRTLCSTGTQFQMEIPFSANGLANGDSLMFYAGPQGEATAFQLAAGAESYTITAMDPNHWVLCRSYTQKDVVLTQALASDHAVYLTWESFDQIPNLAGYLIFRQAAGETGFFLLTGTPVTTNFYLDDTAQNGIQYSYKVVAADLQNFVTMGSNVLSATPVEFAFDWGLLVVDETRDGNGAIITPNDDMVDSFYAAALSPIPYATWDYASMGAPSLNTLSHYPIVLWHADDYTQNLIGDCLDVLGSYLMGNGKLIISGWKTAGSLSDSFRNLFLPGTELVYDNAAVLISALSDIYPDLTPDPDKLTSVWNGMLPMVYTFQNAPQPLYTANMTTGAAGAGLPIAARYETPGTLILFGFPLYFMQADGVRNLLQQLLPELQPELPAVDDNQVPVPLTISAYPNPFRETVTLKFNLKLTPQSQIKVYNTKGQWIADIDLTAAKNSPFALHWKAEDGSGQALPSGIYLLRYSDEKSVLTRKVVILK